MDEIIYFACPECGQEALKPRTQVRSKDDIYTAVCANCGFKFTKDYVLAQLRKIAKKEIGKMKR